MLNRLKSNLVFIERSNLFYINPFGYSARARQPAQRHFWEITGVDNQLVFLQSIERGLLSSNNHFSILNKALHMQQRPSWLFREFREFFGGPACLGGDSRNLLLDYHILTKFLEKKNPSFGYTELWFNFAEMAVCEVDLNFIDI